MEPTKKAWQAFEKVASERDRALEALSAERAKVEALEAEVKRLGLEMNTEYWYAVRDENAKLRAEVKRLRAVVEKLPKTADGVPVSTQDLWHPTLGQVYFSRVCVSMVSDDVEWEYFSDDHRATTPEWCYSTPEAAAAARAKGGSDGE